MTNHGEYQWQAKCHHVEIDPIRNAVYCIGCKSVVSEDNPAVALGKLGGASKSAAKQKASKKNGRKGGRPKKVVDKAAQ
jgi:hypothetical protein